MVHASIPPNAEHPNLLNGLVAKRAEIAGLLEANEVQRCRLEAELDVIDGTIRIFDPDVDLGAIRPKPVPALHASVRGHVTKHVFQALRDATGPLTTRDITLVVMARRGLDTSQPDLVQLIRRRVSKCLEAKTKRGFVRSHPLGGALLGWELVR